MTKPLTILATEPPDEPPVIYERHWPSRIDKKQEIMDEIVKLIIDKGWIVSDDQPWLYLCLDEIIVNAMLHGNEGDPRLEIDITIRADKTRWIITVADHGDGFEEKNIPDQEDPEALLLEHGRGIRIMQEWLDELTYYRGGSFAWLARRRADCPTT